MLYLKYLYLKYYPTLDFYKLSPLLFQFQKLVLKAVVLMLYAATAFGLLDKEKAALKAFP